MAQWIRPGTLNHEIPGSNPLAASVVPLGEALYALCPVPSERTLVPWLLAFKQLAFLVAMYYM